MLKILIKNSLNSKTEKWAVRYRLMKPACKSFSLFKKKKGPGPEKNKKKKKKRKKERKLSQRTVFFFLWNSRKYIDFGRNLVWFVSSEVIK